METSETTAARAVGAVVGVRVGAAEGARVGPGVGDPDSDHQHKIIDPLLEGAQPMQVATSNGSQKHDYLDLCSPVGLVVGRAEGGAVGATVGDRVGGAVGIYCQNHHKQ